MLTVVSMYEAIVVKQTNDVMLVIHDFVIMDTTLVVTKAINQCFSLQLMIESLHFKKTDRVLLMMDDLILNVVQLFIRYRNVESMQLSLVIEN